MRFESTNVDGCHRILPDPHEDERGFLVRLWCGDELDSVGAGAPVAQLNLAGSTKAGTIRGLHWQESPYEELKVVRCVAGSVYDVCADVRPTSPTFGQWHGEQLSAEDGWALVVPGGCAHGYQALEDSSLVIYTTSAKYTPQAERGIAWDDPFFRIRWPIVDGLVVSDKDRSWPPFSPQI